MDDMNSLTHTAWNCKYHIVFTPKYRRRVFFGEKRKEYIANQLKEDRIREQLSIQELTDSFKKR